MRVADNSCIFGRAHKNDPWRHRYVRANGCQFHVVEVGEYREGEPVVLLLHGFPEYWWAWRHQLHALDAAGFYGVAVDLRGMGGTDRTRDAVDGLILTQDIPALVRSLGADQAVVVGLGRGGQLAWSAPAFEPSLFAGVLTFSAPHTRVLQRVGSHLTARTWRHVLQTFCTPLARRHLEREDALRELIQSWSAPGNHGASGQADLYAAAMRLPDSSRIAIEQLRWAYTSAQRPTGRQYFAITREPIPTPTWTVRGERDPLLPPRAWKKDAAFTSAEYEHITVKNVGHFIPEEAPQEANQILLDFLSYLGYRR